MSEPTDMPKLGENQKSYAGIPEAIFVVSKLFFHVHPHKPNLENLFST